MSTLKLFLLTLTITVQMVYSLSFTNIYPKIEEFNDGGDPGKPLFLTPYIKRGQIKEAQRFANVSKSLFHGIESYSGYLTVDETKKSHLFFWYFPAINNPDHKAPVLLWLQGGPGATSLVGLFTENGPFIPVSESKLELRKYSWNLNHNVIYIDNPVGTGFSSTISGYCQNEEDVGRDLYNALIQFFQLFPSLKKNEFFVSGESYAGKYVPALAYTIHKNNQNVKHPIRLTGIAIGNGLSDPIHQLKYGDYLYQLGLIDGNIRSLVQKYEAQGIEYIKNKEWEKAFYIFDNLLNGDQNKHNSLFKNVTGFDNYYNYLNAADNSKSFAFLGRYIQSSEIRKAIHVGDMPFHGISDVVEVALMADVMQSVAPWISELLNHYPILVYNGQLDIIVAYPLTVNYLNNLQFSAADEYKTAKRYVWTVDGDIAGYVKSAGNLTEVLVRNAGHMVPQDQPKWAFDLITRFTQKKTIL